MIWIAIAAACTAAGWLLGTGDDVANRAAIARLALPLPLTGLLGLAIGACFRERIRLRRTHASPSLAYLGKALFFASATALSTYAGAPVAWPPEWIPAVAVGGALGLGTWLANLPLKL